MSVTVCRKALFRLLPLAAALCFAAAAPVLAADAPGLIHSVEIVCHPDQRRAMAAMQEGMGSLPRELSGQMRLLDLDGIWCLRLGEAADEAALRPVLAAVRDKYPQAAMVLGQVGRGRVAARVANRAPGDAGRSEQTPPSPKTPLATPAQSQAAPRAEPPTQARTQAQARPFALPVALALPEDRPLPPATLASQTEIETSPRRLAQSGAATEPTASHPAKAVAAVDNMPAKTMEAATEQMVPAPAASAASTVDAPWPAWAWLAAALAVPVPAAAGYWLGRRRQSRAPVILPHLRDNGPIVL